MKNYFFQIALNTRFSDGCLTYQHPAMLMIGTRVIVTVGKRRHLGIVYKKVSKPEALKTIKPIEETLEMKPVINVATLLFIRWLCDYYHCPTGQGLFFALPTSLKKEPTNTRTSDQFILIDQHPTLTGSKQIAIVNYLKANHNQQVCQLLYQAFPQSHQSIQSLIKKKVIEKKPLNEPPDKLPIFKGARNKHQLNPQQQQSVDFIVPKLSQNIFFCHLINGKTGAGKTEVYLHLTEYMLMRQQQVLILVPEIALTHALFDYFENRLGHQIAVTFHSGLGNKLQHQIWQNTLSGQVQVVIGTRSAVFLPFKALGLVIVDESHDNAFKQNDGTPRYCAKNSAIMRAKQQNIGIVLASGTPDISALYNVQKNKWSMTCIDQKVNPDTPVGLQLVDMNKQGGHILSLALIQKIHQTLASQQQVMLFLNQRGFAKYLYCKSCKHIIHCKGCDRAIVLHLDQKIRCHFCDHTEPAPLACPQCHTQNLKPLGYGTQRIENMIKQQFSAPVLRIDKDQAKQNKDSIEYIKQGHPCIMIGTQMIAKGHHFPNLTVCGILNADQGLLSPDFYQQERFVQLIVQLIGRVGRGKKQGHVIIQTHLRAHPLWQNITQHHQHYNMCIQPIFDDRKRFNLPPFKYHVLIRAKSPNPSLLENQLNILAQHLEQSSTKLNITVHSPLPALLEKVSGHYRYYILLEANKRPALHALIKHCQPMIEKTKQAIKGSIIIDIDPIDMY